MSHVKIAQSGMATSVEVDGRELASSITGAIVQMAAGCVPRVTLEFRGDFDWEGDADVVAANDYWLRTAEWLRQLVGHPGFIRRCDEKSAASTMADDPNDLVLLVLAEMASEGFDVDADGA